MKEILLLQDRLSSLNNQEKCRDSFMEYIRYIWPQFIEGDHHRVVADCLAVLFAFDQDAGNRMVPIKMSSGTFGNEEL